MNSIEVNLDGRPLRIGIVQSRFNQPVVNGMLTACVAELKKCGVDPATSSAPFVATLVDVTGLIIYFSVATVVLRGTVL